MGINDHLFVVFVQSPIASEIDRQSLSECSDWNPVLSDELIDPVNQNLVSAGCHRRIADLRGTRPPLHKRQGIQTFLLSTIRVFVPRFRLTV
jgi:hypothetical protein